MTKPGPVKKIPISDNDDHLGKQIEIKCTGADLVDMDGLTPFQGKLKYLSDDAYLRMKQSILDLGFSFPIAAWKHRNKTFILDAHQRVETLRRMKAEGYGVPKLPVVWIEAQDEREAAKKLLAVSSQYGEIQVDELHGFMERFKLSMPDLATFKSPEIDLPSFELTYFHQPAPISVVGNEVSVPDIAAPQMGDASVAPIRKPAPGIPMDNPSAHWNQMPQFTQNDKMPHRTVLVHFTSDADAAAFFGLIGQKDTGITKTIWFPPQDRMDTEAKRYAPEVIDGTTVSSVRPE